MQQAAREDAPNVALAGAWAAAVAELPPDWSDLYCELELDSSDYLDRAALQLAPINPARVPGRSAFRFRARAQLRLRRVAADDGPLPRAR